MNSEQETTNQRSPADTKLNETQQHNNSQYHSSTVGLLTVLIIETAFY